MPAFAADLTREPPHLHVFMHKPRTTWTFWSNVRYASQTYSKAWGVLWMETNGIAGQRPRFEGKASMGYNH
jgi:hypothetical protein